MRNQILERKLIKKKFFFVRLTDFFSISWYICLENTFCSCGVWRDKEAMDSAMPEMISLLNSSRHLLEEISPEKGVTDPVSGSVVFDQNLSN